jgi:hypothetical protein
VVAGTPTAAPPDAFPAIASPAARPLDRAGGSVHAPGTGAGPSTTSTGPAPAGTGQAAPGPAGTSAAGPAAALEPDVLADECLLDPDQLAALLGRGVRPPEQSVVRRDDGSRSTSCYVTPNGGGNGDAAGDADGPLAAINVYRVRTGTPAAFVRAAGGRLLPGTGPVVAVLDTAAGSTLQVAGRRFLVTLAVQGPEPDDRAWRAAARAALARLPG